jgi:hypothetical protein
MRADRDRRLESIIYPMLQNPQQAMQNVLHTSTDYYRLHVQQLLDTYVVQPLSSFTASSTSDLVSVLLLVLILFVSLKVLDYARRVVLFWVLLALRLLFWASLSAAAIYVYRVGLEQAVTELGGWVGVVQRFVDDFLNQRTAAAASARAGATGYAMYNNGYQRPPAAAGRKHGYGSQRDGGRAW